MAESHYFSSKNLKKTIDMKLMSKNEFCPFVNERDKLGKIIGSSLNLKKMNSKKQIPSYLDTFKIIESLKSKLTHNISGVKSINNCYFGSVRKDNNKQENSISFDRFKQIRPIGNFSINTRKNNDNSPQTKLFPYDRFVFELPSIKKRHHALLKSEFKKNISPPVGIYNIPSAFSLKTGNIHFKGLNTKRGDLFKMKDQNSQEFLDYKAEKVQTFDISKMSSRFKNYNQISSLRNDDNEINLLFKKEQEGMIY